MFKKILVANRGEIACRVMRTAKAMGIKTVAVYSDADARAPHVLMADESVRLGPAPAADSYLKAELILLAAKETGADCIHPGYGFLSERESFALACAEAGIAFVGPPANAIAAMGDKIESKKLAKAAGVNVVPGYLGEIDSTDHAVEIAGGIGYPVMMKASAGGGGKGMRLAYSEQDVREGFEATKREGLASFGDDRVFIEKFIESPRHIEIQLIGDQHGNIVYLNERECSIQRRHQKVVEEAPSPFVTPKMRKAMGEQAVALAQAVGYYSAGTVELIVSGADTTGEGFYFLEMNTRLQVEHPVTEAITGQDLVEWQLRVASGEPLPKRQDELSITGWAMEARLYAENPSTGFLPSTGPLDRLRFPDGVRIDSGVEEGGEVTPYYDPMIAKLIVHGATRAQAAGKLAAAARGTQVWPVRTNAAFLARAAAHPDFVAGRVDTGFIERHADALIPAAEPSPAVLAAAAAAILPAVTGDPWTSLRGFRTNAAASRQVTVEVAGKPYLVTDQQSSEAIVADGVLFLDGEAWPFGPRRADHIAGAGEGDGAILAPMPGRVIAVLVEAGQAVTKGQRMLVLEAMKMEQALLAPFDGVVAELRVTEGAQVSEGTMLARIDKGSE